MKRRVLMLGAMVNLVVLLAAGPTPTPEPTPTLTPQPRQTLFEDDFSSPTPFELFDDEYARATQEEESLIILVKQSEAYGISVLDQDFADVTIEVDVAMTDGSFDNEMGVACRRTDAGEYDFSISSDGYYRIARWDVSAEQLEPLVDWTRSPAIFTGEGHANRIVATCLQDQLTLSVNGHHLATVADDHFTSGKIALYAGAYTEGGVTAAFDNVALLEPAEAGVTLQDADALPLVAEVPVDLPYEDDFSRPSSWWHYREAEYGAAWRANDVFTIRLDAPESQLFAGLGSSFTDVIIEVDVRMVEGPTKNAFGVGCRMYPPANPEMMYQFRIAGDGYYKIFLHKWHGESVALTDWTASPVIKTGPGEVNHLTVACVGDRLTFSVNGEELATVQDDTIAAGDVALVATTYEDGGSTIEYDNFKLSAPSE